MSEQGDPLRALAELYSGMLKPDWYHSDIAIRELAGRVLELERRVAELEVSGARREQAS